MILRVPNTLTTNNSERFIVSIRLSPGGLSFSGYIPDEANSFFYEEVKFDQTDFDFTSFKDFFFANSIFSLTYKKVNVICVNRQYTLVPEDIFLEKETDDLLSFLFSAAEQKSLHKLLKNIGSEIIYGINAEIYEFCSRTLIFPKFTHFIVPLLDYWKKESLNSYPKQLFVYLHDNTIDIACFNKGDLIFINSFNIQGQSDIIFYILYVWKQIGMDQLNDQLKMYTHIDDYENLEGILKTYIKSSEVIKPQMDNKVGLYPNVPFDLIVLYKHADH